MSRLLSLLAVLLLAFDVGLVAARLPPNLQRRSPTPIDVSGLNTNAKRFGRGLPPLPPLMKRTPTGSDGAPRSRTSQCAKSGVIKVVDASTKEVLGYVSKDLKAHQHYTLESLPNAGLFSASVFSSGITTSVNILDVTDASHYLAGLIKKNEQLGDGKGEDKAAILGNSHSTAPGDTPKSNMDPSWNNRDTETAIWTYNHADDSLTAIWVNYAGQTPSITPTYFYWLHDGDRFFLTNSQTPPPNGLAVLFYFISVGDQCGNLRLE